MLAAVGVLDLAVCSWRLGGLVLACGVGGGGLGWGWGLVIPGGFWGGVVGWFVGGFGWGVCVGWVGLVVLGCCGCGCGGGVCVGCFVCCGCWFGYGSGLWVVSGRALCGASSNHRTWSTSIMLRGSWFAAWGVSDAVAILRAWVHVGFS